MTNQTLTAPPVRLISFTQPGLEFDPVEHVYTCYGEPRVGTTTLLRRYRLSADWTVVSPQILEQKRQLGSAAHMATHYDDEGTLERASVAPVVAPYVDAWQLAKRELDFEPLLLETPLAHPSLPYAGTPDRFGFFHRLGPTPAVIDLKLGDPEDAAAGPQTAAYEQLIRALLSADDLCVSWDLWDRAWPRYSVRLLPTGKFTLHTYTNPRDLHRFNWACSLDATAHPSWKGVL